MSKEALSPEAEESIGQNPISYDADGNTPHGKRFFSAVRPVAILPGWGIPGETFMPRGFSQEFQEFLLDTLTYSDWGTLTPLQRKYIGKYVSEDVDIRQIAQREGAIYQKPYFHMKNGLEKLLASLPFETRVKYSLGSLWRFKKEDEDSSSQPKPRPNNPTTIKPERLSFNKSRRNDASPGLLTQKAIDARDRVAQGAGYKVGIAGLPDEEKQKVWDERQREAEKETQRIKKLRATTHDINPRERSLNPRKGAIFNLILAELDVPAELKEFYINNPDLEVENWKSIQARNWGASYLTFRYGQVCYVDSDGRRLYQTDESLAELHDPYSKNGDPETVERFGRMLFKDVLKDIEITATKAGYHPKAALQPRKAQSQGRPSR